MFFFAVSDCLLALECSLTRTSSCVKSTRQKPPGYSRALTLHLQRPEHLSASVLVARLRLMYKAPRAYIVSVTALSVSPRTWCTPSCVAVASPYTSIGETGRRIRKHFSERLVKYTHFCYEETRQTLRVSI